MVSSWRFANLRFCAVFVAQICRVCTTNAFARTATNPDEEEHVVTMDHAIHEDTDTILRLQMHCIFISRVLGEKNRHTTCCDVLLAP